MGTATVSCSANTPVAMRTRTNGSVGFFTTHLEQSQPMSRIRLIAVLIAFVVPCGATNFTVKSDGTGNYTTIQACATAMAAGDTCTVYGTPSIASGTYNESPSIPAGTSGNYKTIAVHGSDVVSVLGFTLASHNQLIGNCPTLQGTVITAACGFFISNPSAPSS